MNNGGNSRGSKGTLDSIHVRGTLSSWLYLSHRVFLQLVLTRPRIYVEGEMDIATFCIEWSSCTVAGQSEGGHGTSLSGCSVTKSLYSCCWMVRGGHGTSFWIVWWPNKIKFIIITWILRVVVNIAPYQQCRKIIVNWLNYFPVKWCGKVPRYLSIPNNPRRPH